MFRVYNYFKEAPSIRIFVGISNDILHLVMAVMLYHGGVQLQIYF